MMKRLHTGDRTSETTFPDALASTFRGYRELRPSVILRMILRSTGSALRNM
jgi:hypothetical protein